MEFDGHPLATKLLALTRALMGIVHDNLSVDQALAIVQK